MYPNHPLSRIALALALTFTAILSAAPPPLPVTHTINLAANPPDKALELAPLPTAALTRLSAQLEIPTEQTTTATDSSTTTPASTAPQGLRIKPRWGKFGAGSIHLPNTFPPGRYSVKAVLVSTEDAAARIALYAILDNKKQIQIAAARGIPAGEHASINIEFYAPYPFSRIALKKMDDSPKASDILATLALTDLRQSEDPFLSAYHQVLRHPAPWNLANPTLTTRLATHLATPPADPALADTLRNTTQRWLDQRSRAAELASQATHLLNTIRILKLDTLASDARRLTGTLDAHRAALASPDVLDETDAHAQSLLTTTRDALADQIHTLQQKTDTLAKGITRPEAGTNIVTWLKNWNLISQGDGKEYSEPTPWRATFPDRSTLSFLPPLPPPDAPPSPTRFESTWTTNLYDTGTHRFYYSILTPLTVVETGTGRIEASTTGFIPGRRDHDAASRPSRWFTLRSDDGQLLFVANRDITGNQFTSGRLVLEFAPSARSATPVALGYVRLPREPAAPLETIARFYQTLLACQPIQCAQVQRGDEVELTYEYRLRPTHNAGNAANAEPFTDTIQPPANAAPLAPLPHLLQTWLKTAAGHDALAPGKLQPADLQTSPDGWLWLASRHTLRHTLPATRTTSVRHGINIWLNRATRENYAELAAQGCQHIRLVLRSESKWDWANADELKTLVQRNLAWIRETGAGKMQAYPALFGSWAPDLLHKATGFGDTPDALAAQAEWLRRWQAIMDWCRPYADVIACYDLLNEPRIFSEHHDVTAYYEFLRRNLPALRAAAGPVPLLVEVANMANPVGLNHWRTPDPAADDTNTIIGYHDYWPHMFTHQQVVDPQPVVFYPSFMPMIEWKAPSWRNDSKHWHYWDRWKCDAVNYPVFKHLVENVPANTRMDCGEYGVVGYAGKAPQSGSIWLTHALERFDRLGINHAVWGINGGYTWTVPAFKQTILDHWKRKTETSDQ